MTKYRNKYRIDSTRLKNWDYKREGIYFITICTKHREHFFGNINNGKMILSDLGKIVELEWEKTFALRKDMNLKMGEYIVMPNHFHAIIVIGKNQYNNTSGRDAMHCVSTGNTFGPQSKNLPSIIRGFKSSVTTFARKKQIMDFAWQPRYYDHIIRNYESLQKISEYIINNPKNWNIDEFYSST